MLRQLARSAVFFALHRLGGISAVRRKYRRTLRVLCYHRFEDTQRGYPAEWERQCRHLRRHYTPVSITQVAEAARTGRELPADAVLVTVDDGFSDFYRIAYPIAARYRIPCTVYLVSGFVDHGGWLWWSVLDYVLENTRYESWQAPGLQLDFRTLEQRRTSSVVIANWLKRRSPADRAAFVAGFAADMGVNLPVRPPEAFAPLTWEQVREMQRGGMDFGCHTATHPMLPQLDEAGLRAEIEGSRTVVEERLQRPSAHFCYPNGDYDERCERVVRQAGFATAATCVPRFNEHPVDALHLGRVMLAPTTEWRYFERLTAGLGLSGSSGNGYGVG